MRLLLLLFFVINLYGSPSSNEETCYTVQLVSKYNNKVNRKILDETSYPKICKLMDIGQILTVRCGCVGDE